MAGEFVPGSGGKDCTEKTGGWGNASTSFDWIWKGNIDQNDYPEEACLPWYHRNFQIDDIQLNSSITGSGSVNISGTVTASEVTAGGITLTSRKAFDIPHPTKDGYRLRYICLEGPEAEVYLRGKLDGSTNIIELPEYWRDLVDVETIGVSLTPIGIYQELYVEKIEWGTKIIIRNNLGSSINCSYVVYGQRKDVPRNISEYEGTSAKDYPGEIDPYVP